MMLENRTRQKSAMNTRSTSYARENSPMAQRPEISDALVEIKIPQRMVNLPVCPAGLFRNILLAMLALVMLALLFLVV